MMPTLNKDLRLLLFVVACLTGLAACESAGQQCYEPVVIRVTNNFLASDTSLKQDTVDGVLKNVIDTTYYDSVMPAAEMRILDEDTVFYVLGTELTTNVMRIALDPQRDSVRYLFRADTANNTSFDTITYFYSPAVHFVSNNCGYTYYYTLSNIKTTNHLLDSVSIINTSVTNDASTRNVRLFFKKTF